LSNGILRAAHTPSQSRSSWVLADVGLPGTERPLRGDHAVFFALLDRFARQAQQLTRAQTTADQHRDHRMVSECMRSRRCRVVEQLSPLLGSQPIPETDAEAPDASHTADPRREFMTEEPRVSRLIRHAERPRVAG
jgi:hypothetical protein